MGQNNCADTVPCRKCALLPVSSILPISSILLALSLFYFCVHSPSKSEGSVHTAPRGLLLCAWRPLACNAQEKASQFRSSLPGWVAAGGCRGGHLAKSLHLQQPLRCPREPEALCWRGSRVPAWWYGCGWHETRGDEGL